MDSNQYEAQYALFKDTLDKNRGFLVSDANKWPILNDDTNSTPYDSHYLYHTAWAARRIVANKPKDHVDFSSYVYFSTILSAILPVRFYDYRPLNFSMNNFFPGKQDLCQTDFGDSTLSSVSCMHVIEHIGLGRYGDPIDPQGDIRAINELKRIVAKNGYLYIVLPVAGVNKVHFNAHRVYTYRTIMDLFSGFTLKSSAVLCDRTGVFICDAPESYFNTQNYGCGCFEFCKG